MNTTWFFDSRFHVFQHDLSLAGIVAFAAAVAIGLLISATIQHEKIRLFLTRLGLDKNFIAIATSVVGLTLLISSIVIGLNLGGLPMHWEAPMPGIGISVFCPSSLYRCFMVRKLSKTANVSGLT